MSTILSYQKKLCMTEFNASYSSFPHPHFFDFSAGKIYSSFIFITKGSVEIRFHNQTQRFEAGELFYLPNGIGYAAYWHGAPNIEYYSLQAVATNYNTTLATERFALQKLPALANGDTERTFREIFRLMQTDERINKLKALSLYYAFYADALPLLEQMPSIKFPPALTKAVELLDTRYAEDTPVSDIARECFVSESRLYHLFREHLNTTPVAYRNERRIQKATELLTSEKSVEKISDLTGFHSAAYFRETFKQHTGLTPSEYRRILL